MGDPTEDTINKQVGRACFRGTFMYVALLGGLASIASWSSWLEEWRLRISAEPWLVLIVYVGWMAAYLAYECLQWHQRQQVHRAIKYPQSKRAPRGHRRGTGRPRR